MRLPLIPLAAFIRTGFLRLLAYRLRYFTGILTYTIQVSVYYFIWRAVFSHAGPDGLHGYDLGQITTYLALGWVIRSFHFNNIDREIASLVAEGHITTYLARPVHLHHAMMGLAAGESLFRLTAFTGPISIVIFLLFPVSGPAGIGAFSAFCLSTVLSFLLMAYMNFLVGLTSFVTRSVAGIINAKQYTIMLLSGLLMPLTFFPDWLQNASTWLPFRHLSNTPVILFLGRVTGSEIAAILAIQTMWVIVLHLVTVAIWSRMLRRLVIQGG